MHACPSNLNLAPSLEPEPNWIAVRVGLGREPFCRYSPVAGFELDAMAAMIVDCEQNFPERYDVVLCASFDQADAYRRAHAGAALFGVAVTAFEGWIADLWELHGDGRALIDSFSRRVAMQAVFEHAGLPAWAASPGFVQLAAEIAQKGAGLPELDAAFDAARSNAGEACSFSENEQLLLGVVADYLDAIAGKGFIELGQALDYLTKCDEAFPVGLDVLLVDAAPLPWQQRWFLDSVDNLRVVIEQAPGADGVLPQDPSCSVDFAYASGGYAQPGLIADIVRDCADQGTIFIASAKPLALYEAMAPRLAEEGICCEVSAKKPFSETAFGRAYLAMLRCLHGEPWSPDSLVDVLVSPFAGVGKADARDFAARIEQDRLANREDYLAAARVAYEAFSQLEELALDPDADILLGAFADAVSAHVGWSEAFRREQLAAIEALRRVSEAARVFGLGMASCEGIFASTSVEVSRKSLAKPDAVVRIGSQDDIACCGSATAQVLVLTDMNSADYPVADKDDAASVLFAKLGLAAVDSALAQARRRFRALQQVPASRLVVERATHDANAEETYPCVVLEEFIDACKNSPSFSTSGIERGEEDLFANAVAASCATVQDVAACVSDADRLGVSPLARERMLLPRFWYGSRYTAPSPSQIEAYLECPRKWFVQNRLGARSHSEEFGPLEKGLFAHSALEEFYRAFQEAGHAKVTPDNLDEAHALMGRVLDGLAERQSGEEPGSGRLVAVNELEERALASFKRQIDGFLDYETALLPTFAPRYMEYVIGLPGADGVDCSAEYAGVQLVGKIDRIDVDGKGNAVIIDYKGSLSADNAIAKKDALHAGKVQTRIYAQAIRHALGLNVVGALYVSYGRRHEISGAFDPRVIDVAHLPNINPEKCACALCNHEGFDAKGFVSRIEPAADGSLPLFSALTFDGMLDATEEVVAGAVSRMQDGDIEPRPASKDACRYCPDSNCPKRSV